MRYRGHAPSLAQPHTQTHTRLELTAAQTPAPHPLRPQAFTQVKLLVGIDGVSPVISNTTMNYHYNK